MYFNAPENKPLDPDPEKWAIANSIVVGSIIKRRSEQSLNFMSFVWLFFGIGIFFFWGWGLNATNNKAANKAIERATKQALLRGGVAMGTMPANQPYIILGDTFTPGPITSTPFPTLANDAINTPGVVQTYAANVFWATMEAGYTATPTPTIIPTKTVTPTPTEIYSIDFVFTYSYYNPKLGGWNCLLWDDEKQDCMSAMANGEDWRNNYGVAVACPPDIALGTVIEVSYPDALKGKWICKDRGSAITGKWIDFLDIKQRAQWGESVSAKLYPPSVPMEQITGGTH